MWHRLPIRPCVPSRTPRTGLLGLRRLFDFASPFLQIGNRILRVSDKSVMLAEIMGMLLCPAQYVLWFYFLVTFWSLFGHFLISLRSLYCYYLATFWPLLGHFWLPFSHFLATFRSLFGYFFASFLQFQISV